MEYLQATVKEEYYSQLFRSLQYKKVLQATPSCLKPIDYPGWKSIREEDLPALQKRGHDDLHLRRAPVGKRKLHASCLAQSLAQVPLFQLSLQIEAAASRPWRERLQSISDLFLLLPPTRSLVSLLVLASSAIRNGCMASNFPPLLPLGQLCILRREMPNP